RARATRAASVIPCAAAKAHQACLGPYATNGFGSSIRAAAPPVSGCSTWWRSTGVATGHTNVWGAATSTVVAHTAQRHPSTAPLGSLTRSPSGRSELPGERRGGNQRHPEQSDEEAERDRQRARLTERDDEFAAPR